MERIGWPRWRRGLAPAVLLTLCLGLAALSDRDPISSYRTQEVARGAALYATNCERCHGDAQGLGKIPEAPPHGPGGHSWGHRDEQLIQFIMRGSPPRYGSADWAAMPAWRGKLTESDVSAIVALMKTWWSPEENESRRNWYGCRPDSTPSC
jgi:mono/diheme cytochrome c family protein